MFARAIQIALLVAPFIVAPLSVFAGASLSACAGGQQSGEEEDQARRGKKKKKTKHRKHPPDKDAVSEKGKSWGGWRWKGDRDDCYFVHKNRCFDSKSRACEKAKCGKRGCQVDDGAPSKVTCK